MPPLSLDIPGMVESPSSSFDLDDDESQSSGYVEVKAVEGPTGTIKDEIMIISPPRGPANTVSTLTKISRTSTYSSNVPGFLETIPDNDDNHSRNGEESKLDELDQLEFSFMEELADKLNALLGCHFNDCAQDIYAPPTLKSAMRKSCHDSDGSIPPIDRNVSFTQLQIHEFNMTLGNHPNAVTGPPVMLDWEARPKNTKTVDLDLYERARQPRRNRRELKLSFEDRRGILENERGFTVEEVKQAWSEALKIRKQRMETRLRTPTQQAVDEVWESACRKYNRMFEWNMMAQ